MSSIDKPRDNYVSAQDFRDRTMKLGTDDPDTKLYPDDNETLVWMMQVSRDWGGHQILEVGCGHGRWAKHLQGRYLTYVGIDPVIERIESARRLWPLGLAHFFQEDNPIQEGREYNSPSIVFAVDVLQHLGLVTALNLFQRITMLLPKGGRFVTWDGCLGRWTQAQCEEMYRARPEHMIPKPIEAFEQAAPNMRWELVDGTRLIAVKE